VQVVQTAEPDTTKDTTMVSSKRSVTAALLCVLAFVTGSGAQTTDHKPNIVVIHTDNVERFIVLGNSTCRPMKNPGCRRAS
jgi:hypothetical protein